MTRLETERLILRPYREDDLDGFYACVSDPEVVRYEPYRPMSREEAGQTLASRSWVMCWPANIGAGAMPGKAVRL